MHQEFARSSGFVISQVAMLVQSNGAAHQKKFAVAHPAKRLIQRRQTLTQTFNLGAYQGDARDLGIEEVRRVNEAGLQGIWPDRVLLLQVEAAAALEREDTADRISVEGVALQRKVAEAYALISTVETERFRVIDASRPIEDVIDDAIAAVIGP